MNKLIIFIMFLGVGCGQRLDNLTSNELPQTNNIDVELMRHVETFEATFEKPVLVDVELKEELTNYCLGQEGCGVTTPNLDPNVDAVCWSSGGEGRRVEVRASRWDELGEQAREQLIYHELGHCTLGQGHRNEDYKDTYCPASIMNMYTFNEWQVNNCYLPGKDYYFSELAIYIKE